MSMMLNSAGIFSGLSNAPAIADHLSFTPNGYAGQASSRGTAGDLRFEVRFRLDSLSGNQYILGSSVSGRIPIYFSGGNFFTAGGGGQLTAIGSGISINTWYKAIFSRTGSTSSLTVTDELDVTVASGSTTSSLGAISWTYVARYLSSYSGIDVRYIAWGTPSATNEHLYEMQDSGTTWNDTGTVSGWNMALLGSPAPSWEA